MSKLVIKNENQLLHFLNLLAEESVQQAYAGMGGEEQQKRVAKSIAASKKTFIEEEDPPGETPGVPDAPTPEKPADQQPEPKTGTPSIAPKFDSLVDAINDLRGSPSSKDSSVETQLRAYYDKLEAAEAASAILYIRTLSQVMKGEVDGATAADPSEYQINTTMKDDSSPGVKAPEVAQQQAATAAPKTATLQSSSEDSEQPEDTAPPIKVGSSQVTESYRNKIKALLSRG